MAFATSQPSGSMQAVPGAGHAMVPYAGHPNAAAQASQFGSNAMVAHAGNATTGGTSMVPYNPNMVQAHAGNATTGGTSMVPHNPNMMQGASGSNAPMFTNQPQMPGMFSNQPQMPGVFTTTPQLPPVARKQKPKLEKSLQKKFNKDGVMRSLDTSIHDYSKRHGGRWQLQGEKGAVAKGPRTKELAILDKQLKDVAEGAKMIPAEEVLSKTLKAGFREYIDYALDEVERFANAETAGSLKSFDWKLAGDAFDVPALRRSRDENGVGGGPQEEKLSSQKHSNMFQMDFVRDFRRKADGSNPALGLRPPEEKERPRTPDSLTSDGSETARMLDEMFNDGAPDQGKRTAEPWNPEYPAPWKSEYTLI